MNQPRRKRYVIVGCGASATALVAKLCQDKSVEVVVLEQGSVSWPLEPVVHDASLWGKAALHERTDFVLTTPQENLLKRQIRLPLGSGIGGSTNVNAMIFGLGHRQIFDQFWPDGFDAAAMERAVKEVADLLGVTSTHSCLLPHASKVGEKISLSSLWEESAVRSSYLTTMKDGERLTMQKLVFQLVAKHRTLRVIMNARVQEVLFHDATAVGVRYVDTKTGKTCEIHTTRGGEVILCAGALSTPCLLLQSKLGKRRLLRRLFHGPVTPVVENFPDIGRRILDHTVTPLVMFGLWKPKQQHAGAPAANSIHGYIFLTADGRLCSEPNDIPRTQLVFFDGRIAPHILAELVLPRWAGSELWTGLSSFLLFLLNFLFSLSIVQWLCSFVYGCLICNVQPRSEGSVLFGSAQPTKGDGFPQIHALPDMQYNQHESDRDALWQAYRTAKRYLLQTQGSSENGDLPHSPCKPLFEILPGPLGWNSSLFSFYMSWLTTTYFHYSGTCRMGNISDPDTVVDSSFCVKHLSKLRVCDASIIPHLPTVPIAATCFALGNILGEKLLSTSPAAAARNATTKQLDLGNE